MRQTGTVARFLDDKGFGFITPDGGGRDVFVHRSQLPQIPGNGRPALKTGARVTFELAHDAQGRAQADAVTVLA